MSANSKLLRTLLAKDKLYFAPGVYDGLSAKILNRSESCDIAYASGGAIARSMGLPDMGLISWTQIVERLQTIVDALEIPVIADFDNGYGNALNVVHTVKHFERTGVAAIHMEDQALPKRCGHLSGKKLISTANFIQKIKAVKDVTDPDFYLIARTDAIAVEGFDAAIERAQKYYEAGADMIFVEAPTTIEQIEGIAQQLTCPKLLNMFHSGKTPLVKLEQLHSWGYNIVIDPSDLQRAAITAMQKALQTIEKYGHSETISDSLASFSEREALVDSEKYLQLSNKYK